MSWRLSFDELVFAVGGEALSRHQEIFSGIGTDTRKDLTGKIFIALKGDAYDAHAFLPQAVSQGAGLLIIQGQAKDLELLKRQVSIIRVNDTLKALQDLGRFWRRRQAYQVVGITGSNGKTTTKGFTQQILTGRFRSFAAEGSLNNHWGVPMSLLSAEMETEVIVQEMGMNHLHEIEALCAIAEPDIVGVTMVGRSHIGELGSQENIARAKEEIYQSRPKAKMIFNLDNPFTLKMYEDRRRQLKADHVWRFSAQIESAEVYLRCTQSDLSGLKVSGHIGGMKSEVQVPVFGAHNLTNILAASAFSLAVGAEPEHIWSRLPQLSTGWGRNQLLRMPSGATLLFDAYNANPESMAASLNALSTLPGAGRKVAVLGEMLELGHEAADAHRGLGELIAKGNFAEVWFYGPHAEEFSLGLKSKNFQGKAQATQDFDAQIAKELGHRLSSQDMVLLKGSRGMRLERVLELWNLKDRLAKS